MKRIKLTPKVIATMVAHCNHYGIKIPVLSQFKVDLKGSK